VEFETWWLLVIPLAFGLGWAAARLDNRASKALPKGLPDAYFKGLNFLLNEQSDKAVDAFIDVVKLEPETIELHFALGNLFRRRGEIDRAIRVHENLVSRTTLTPEQRSHALFELGQDYLKAGLLDRAEDAFSKLEGTEYANAALRLRLDSAQMVKDWPVALSLLDRMTADDGEPSGNAQERSSLRAHFHCEIAAQHLASTVENRYAPAQEALTRALAADGEHVRTHLMLGALYKDQGLDADVLESWQWVLANAPEHLSLVAREWAALKLARGDADDAIGFFERLLAKTRSADGFAALVSLREAREGSVATLNWAHEYLQKEPSLLGLESYLKTETNAGFGGESNKDAQLLGALVKHQSARVSRYVCGHCGFKARQYYWHCPGCNRWDTYPPRRLEDLKIDG
jgi:lipopolysaccharide assembly protein B